MFDFLDVKLSQKTMLAFFCVAVFAFVFPLILVDHFYMDDSRVALAAGMALKERGRLLTEWLYQSLSFTQGAPNIFPLPLLIASVAMSFALRALTKRYFLNPTVVSCLVVLPLWYSPFFLQNLSYQYDGPAMALGVVAVIYAITFLHPSLTVRTVVSAVCIAIGLSLYQVVINIYFGLCCIELIRAANECKGLRISVTILRDRFLQFLLGLMIYWLTAYQFIGNDLAVVRQINSDLLGKLFSDFHLALQRVALLYNDSNAWLCWTLLVIACAGFVKVIYRVLRMRASVLHKVVLAGLCVLAIAVAFASIAGLLLIFDYGQFDARVMMGFSSGCVLIFYLSYLALTTAHPRLGGVLIIPVIAMLSFSYAYGRVMNVQKALEISVAYNISYEITSAKELRGVERYYMVTDWIYWLVGADGSYNLIPALKYVLNMGFLFFPELIVRSTGVTNVAYADSHAANYLKKLAAKENASVDNKFYSIYVDGVDGYIVMKAPSADDVFVHH